jgi:hypothetical protein
VNIEKEIVGRTAVLMLMEDLPHEDAEARAINEIAVETKQHLGRRMARPRPVEQTEVAASPTVADDAAWVRRFLLEPVCRVIGPTLERYNPSPLSQPPHTRRRRENGLSPPPELADQPATTATGPLVYTSGDGARTAIDITDEFARDPRFYARDEATRNHRAQNPR